MNAQNFSFEKAFKKQVQRVNWRMENCGENFGRINLLASQAAKFTCAFDFGL